MNKHAYSAIAPQLNDADQQELSNAEMLQLKNQKEDAIRSQLAEFAKEIEQLKKLHKTH